LITLKQAEPDFTDAGLWTPQTSMLNSIHRWVQDCPFRAGTALSIDQNPTLDQILRLKWPGLLIEHAIHPRHDAQNLRAFADDGFDLVYSHQVLEHLPKPWLAAHELVRVLKPGGVGLHTTCAYNPRHGPPAFNDYYRFLPDGLAALFDGVEILTKGGWGNRQALLYNLAIDDGHGALGGRRFHKSIGEANDENHPWVTWVIFQKKSSP
jgi:SAM-dependent methyltransferase